MGVVVETIINLGESIKRSIKQMMSIGITEQKTTKITSKHNMISQQNRGKKNMINILRQKNHQHRLMKVRINFKKQKKTNHKQENQGFFLKKKLFRETNPYGFPKT